MKKNRKNRLSKKRYNVSTPNKNKSSVSYTKFRRNKCTESVKNLKQERSKNVPINLQKERKSMQPT